MASTSDVLNLLRQNTGKYISGEQLSHEMGVSRSAIWKHIRHLETAGYQIEAAPHKGYRLISVPDRCLPDEIEYQLNTKKIGRKIFAFNKITSTNDRAMALADNGAPEGSLIIAEEQTSGRGRRQRTWVAEPGKHLLFSVIFRPRWTIEQVQRLTQMMVIAAARAIRRETGLAVSVKWPNDLLIEGKKIAGVLTEMRGQADAIDFVIVGLGLNVNGQAPKNVRYPTTTLQELTGHSVNRLSLLRVLLEEAEALYAELVQNGMETIIKEWKNLSMMIGTLVKAEYHEISIEGMVMGINDMGHLLIRTELGLVKALSSGEINGLKISK